MARKGAAGVVYVGMAGERNGTASEGARGREHRSLPLRWCRSERLRLAPTEVGVQIDGRSASGASRERAGVVIEGPEGLSAFRRLTMCG